MAFLGKIGFFSSPYSNVTDQFTHSFLPKILIVLALLMFYTGQNDRMSCLLPGKSELERVSQNFVEETCWTQGFFIYANIDPSYCSYYGIPYDLKLDGVHEDTS